VTFITGSPFRPECPWSKELTSFSTARSWMRRKETTSSAADYG
jgi:hypothetical protein